MTKAADLSKTGSLVNSSGQLDLTTGVTGVLPVANGGTGSSSGVSPGGSNTQVQYNNAGAFGGSANFVFDGTNVGIGTSSPSQKLQVQLSNATAYSSGVTGNGLYIYNSSATTGQYAGITLVGEPTTGNGGIATIMGTTTGSGNMDLTFSTRGSATLAERMRIDSSGNVGIGTTTPTAFAAFSPILDLKGGAPAIAFHDTTASAINFTIAVNSNQMDFYNDSTSTSLMTLLSSGNVGIGTSTISTPSSRAVTLQVGSNSSGGSSELLMGHQGDGFSLITSGGSGVGSLSVMQGTTSLAEYTYQGIFKFNSGYGSAATAYGCRAWVNFNGTGTVAIRSSGNVSSITDNGTGLYTVNFSTAMPDTNYAITGAGGEGGTTGMGQRTPSIGQVATSSVVIASINQDASYVDPVQCCIAIFR